MFRPLWFVVIFVLISSGLVVSELGWAEPWIANRMAQNCAGCHAPGRINRPPSERRCTLSCQGCHTNPNGGGLRSQYGKWTEERWLRSFYSDIAWNTKQGPAPYKEQVYHRGPQHLPEPLKKNLARNVVDMERGLPMKTRDNRDADEAEFDRVADPYDYVAKNQFEDFYKIPQGDPLRLERTIPVYAGGDLRFFFIQGDLENVPEDEMPLMWPMGLDTGLRIRPIRKNLQLVLETRWINSLNGSSEELFTNKVITRSAYALVDELPYNTYLMYGLFRPMFGNYQPDHTALAQQLSGFSYDSVFKGVSLGSAPNVPFANVTMIMSDDSPAVSPEEGFALNFGARFVSYGFSAIFSYWDTKAEGIIDQARSMTAVNLGLSNWNWTPNLEILMVEQTRGENLSKFNVITLENKYKLWRENYILLNVATADTAIQNFGPGSTAEAYLGFRNYWLSGLSTELLFKNRNETRKLSGGNLDVTEKALIFQAHAYF